MKHNYIKKLLLVILSITALSCAKKKEQYSKIENFNSNWWFHLGPLDENQMTAKDSTWRMLDLPHDWSIEGEFSPEHPAGTGGGALPGGIGWYQKEFALNPEDSGKQYYIHFDGVYMNSEVWINDHYLGKRPYGYISFRYDLTPHLNFRNPNTIAVKVDNSKQPNSRWYSGSGIYRNVYLITSNLIHVANWGTYITTPEVSEEKALVNIETTIKNTTDQATPIELITEIHSDGRLVSESRSEQEVNPGENNVINQEINISNPILWDLENPHLYTAITRVMVNGELYDQYETPFGIRTFEFKLKEGFFLNGKQVKIKGVNNHHDLGPLGAAVNARAIKRQLEILKEMGVNGIRTSHNPPAPELLDLCDKMGFIVMDEAFDVWSKPKVEYDYAMYWDEWHEKDLTDFIKRDRNHPSVFIWSTGNEILNQWDSTGATIARELTEIVKSLDPTRPITVGMNPPNQGNTIATSGALDLIGYNYHHKTYKDHFEMFPDTPFIATETTSALATRGHYDMPSDTIKRWPIRWDLPFTEGNPDNTVSAYDHVSTPWGSTHEETWKVVKKHDFMSGMFIWTGFDYIGEPTPYGWPSKSSYFGIIDLAGFPKDTYYMYQSEWTDKDVLHIYPHWNWNEGDSVDVWAYFNADEAELFLNEESLGTKRKTGDDLHVWWRVAFEPGTLKAVSRTNGEVILEKEIHTTSEPYAIELSADRSEILADGRDLSFITVKILDKDGNVVPYASNLVEFEVEGNGHLKAVGNGNPTSHESFLADHRKAFHGLCLAVIQSSDKAGKITLKASGEGLEGASIEINSKELIN